VLYLLLGNLAITRGIFQGSGIEPTASLAMSLDLQSIHITTKVF
jgi:hypothetical protein